MVLHTQAALLADDKKTLHVAVGFIVRQQQVLISWRTAQQHQGERFEFPGGKIEAGESPAQGLVRELSEELGIEAFNPIHMQRLYYDYPEKSVCLHVFKVDDFVGEPVGKEGQAIQWVDITDLPNYRFPDANMPILRAARCPAHYLICYEQTAVQTLADWLDFHVQRVPHEAWLYVRHHQLSAVAYQQVIEHMQQARPDLSLVVMYRHLSQLTVQQLAQCAGVHYSRQDVHEVQGSVQHDTAYLTFAACKNAADIAQAQQLGIDALLLSPVQHTHTHPTQTPLGWQQWQALAQHSHVPVYALGGVGPADVEQAQQHGAFAVAGIRAFYG